MNTENRSLSWSQTAHVPEVQLHCVPGVQQIQIKITGSEGFVQNSNEKIHMTIAGARRYMDACYLELGKLCAALNREKAQPAYRGLMEEIAASERLIAHCERELNREEEQMQCGECGAWQPAANAFCTSCGESLRPGEEHGAAICRECGAPLIEGNLYCTNCGARIDGTEDKSNASPAREAAKTLEQIYYREEDPVRDDLAVSSPDRISSGTDLPICPHCGGAVSAYAVFCRNCGRRL